MKAVVALVAAAVLATACTSFSFKSGGKGAAPDELKDRSVMVKIVGATFDMGAQEGEADEYPPHKVEITSFLMDKTEVTAGDYGRCVQAHACRPPVIEDEESKANTTERHPVVGISWFDADKYCAWVNKRLPSEAEWELAARAPKMNKFPWDGRFEPTLANTAGSADGYERTAPVGSFPKGASGYGLLDMAGNAAEWTNDWYDAVAYQKACGLGPPSAEGKPVVGDCKTVKNPKGPEAATGSKVVRGGSWTSNGDYLVRATSRTSADPNVSSDSVGFRCASDL
ncbi:MAG TPA: formylglycine-generating enzyme family protein [Myxococcota bacterium]|jgi:formylglycine-generating enzyme required for sulfatase activity